jgi:hypothetical protein
MQEFVIGDVYLTVDEKSVPPLILSAYEGDTIEFYKDGAVYWEYPSSASLDVEALMADPAFMQDVAEELANIACQAYEKHHGI